LKEEYEKALTTALQLNDSRYIWCPFFRAAVSGRCGRHDWARKAFEELLVVKPDFSKNWRKLMLANVFYEETVDKLLAGLAMAGLSL
jgi:hypothetical protein